MRDKSEYDPRCEAVRLYYEGIGFTDILRGVHRSGFWLTKWLRRYKEEGLKGLQDHDRTPDHSPNKTLEALVRKVLAIRDELVAHKTPRSVFSGIGAETTRWELSQRGVRRMPSIPTIHRILARAGKTGRGKPKKTEGLAIVRTVKRLG